MAVTASGRAIQMTAVNDSLNQATMQGGAAGVYRVRANAIMFVNAAATTAVTLRVNGIAGMIIYSQTLTIANDTVVIAFSEPQDLDDFTVTALPASATVVVLLA